MPLAVDFESRDAAGARRRGGSLAVKTGAGLVVAVFVLWGCSDPEPAAPAWQLRQVEGVKLYPASHQPLPEIRYFGGRVLASPRVVTVTFTGMEEGLRDELRTFGDALTTTPYWRTIMDGYGVGPGAGGGHVELPAAFAEQATSDEALKGLLAGQIESGAIPFPSSDALYVVYLPRTAKLGFQGLQSCQDFVGYHFSGTASVSGRERPFVYAVVGDCSPEGTPPETIRDRATSVASHEIAESVTDPDVNVQGRKAGYYMVGNDAWAPTLRGGEVGDLCERDTFYLDRSAEGVSGATGSGQWRVARIWNATAARRSQAPCVPAAKPWFFGAVPRTEVPAAQNPLAPNADGYIVVRKGMTRDVHVDVFSTEKLPSDLTLTVGGSELSPDEGDEAPAVMAGVRRGVTTSLSKRTARNGESLVLTIAVDSSAESGVSRLGVRAILSDADYHTWPVILYIP
jgi:hypothetical protein